MKVLFVWPNMDFFGCKPIAISLLAGIARNEGWETRLYDTSAIDFGFVERKEAIERAKIVKPVDLTKFGHKREQIDLASDFARVLEEYNPDCLAISVLSDEAFIADRISTLAKKVFPHLPIIWGGKYPTIDPARALRRHDIDFVCVGEGLDAFGEFLSALAGKEDLTHIPNIWAKSRDGEIIAQSIRPLRDTLDDLPFLYWDIFADSQFYRPYEGNVYRSGDHMLNWGCPNHCTYCINHLYHKMYKNKYFMRRYSIERIINELKFLTDRYSLQFFRFFDEDFLMRPLRNFAELSEAYKSEVNLPFVIETNPKSVTKEKVKLLKNMNCVSASLGVETGDPHLRKNILGRVDTEEEIIRAFRLLNDAGIRTSSFIMLGIPFETRKTYEKTIEVLKKAQVQYPSAAFFFPYEGTELREISIRNGFFAPQGQEGLVYKHDEPTLHFDALDKNELIVMREVFNLYVKLPEDFKYYIRRSESPDSIGKKLRKKLVAIYDETVFQNNGWYKDEGLKDTYIGELELLVQEAQS